jgi:hypothetical protein
MKAIWVARILRTIEIPPVWSKDHQIPDDRKIVYEINIMSKSLCGQASVSPRNSPEFVARPGIPLSGEIANRPELFLAAGVVYFGSLGMYELLFERLTRRERGSRGA